jgi:hypothetical protein
MKNLKSYTTAIIAALALLSPFVVQVNQYVNGINGTIVLVLIVPIDIFLGITWRRYRNKEVVSGYHIVWRNVLKFVTALLPATIEVIGLLLSHWVGETPWVPDEIATGFKTHFIFSIMALTALAFTAYLEALSLTAGWWLAGHPLTDKVYDWARDEIKKKLANVRDAEPINNSDKIKKGQPTKRNGKV